MTVTKRRRRMSGRLRTLPWLLPGLRLLVATPLKTRQQLLLRKLQDAATTIASASVMTKRWSWMLVCVLCAVPVGREGRVIHWCCWFELN